MSTHAAISKEELPNYSCKRHGKVEPIVSWRSNGYLHRRCPTCLKEGFDKRAWQRERRARLALGLGPKGRAYKRASVPAELPEYICKRHGPTTAKTWTNSDGYVKRRCPRCFDEKASDEWTTQHRKARAIYMRGWNRRLKFEAIKKYGDKCRCCGEQRIGLLSIDHVKRRRLESSKI